MPANLYGVNNSPSSITKFGVPSDVNCPAGAETIIATSPGISAASQGYYFVVISGWVAISFGATIPGSLSIAARIGGGSDYDSMLVHPGLFVASATIQPSFALPASTSSGVWFPTGTTVSVTINVTAQAVIARGGWDNLYVQLTRAPDQ